MPSDSRHINNRTIFPSTQNDSTYRIGYAGVQRWRGGKSLSARLYIAVRCVYFENEKYLYFEENVCHRIYRVRSISIYETTELDGRVKILWNWLILALWCASDIELKWYIWARWITLTMSDWPSNRYQDSYVVTNERTHYYERSAWSKAMGNSTEMGKLMVMDIIVNCW